MKKNPIFLIAGIALFVAFANLPYSYYQFLRWFICGVGIYGVCLSYGKRKTGWLWILGAIALLFNPFVVFHFAREAWRVIYLVSGALFCVYFGSKEK